MGRVRTWIRNIFCRLLEKNAGYLTIELTIIFPAIFFSLLLILFMGMVLYQEVNLQSLAVQASERGSVVYSSRVSDMTTGIKTLEDFKIRDPYRNVPFLGGGKKGEYTSLVNRYVAERMGKRDILQADNQNGGNYTAVEDYLIAKRIKVNIHSTYHTPVDAIAKMFGQSSPFEVNTTAVSAVVDAPDFVRNMDIIVDVASQTEAFGTIQKGYGRIKEAIQKVADLLK
ncbi:MAG: pilus assembly protein [Lachnospiraceae bacterium]|nr:pilus assembly protein [Lachnospiraceae bacterium]